MLSLSFWLAALSCACLLAAGALFLFSRTPPSHVGARRPPLAPGCNWLMGHLLLMAPPDHHEPLRDLVDKTGPAFRVRLPAIGTVHILVEGAAVRHVLATFPKSPFCVSGFVSSLGLVARVLHSLVRLATRVQTIGSTGPRRG